MLSSSHSGFHQGAHSFRTILDAPPIEILPAPKVQPKAGLLIETASIAASGYVISKYFEIPLLSTTAALFASSIAIGHIFKIDTALHCSLMKLIGHKEAGMCEN